MAIIHIPDIRYHILKHLPYIDRREFSRICRDFREPNKKVFRAYLRKGLTVMGLDPEMFLERFIGSYISGEFLLWVLIELTLDNGSFRRWEPCDIHVHTEQNIGPNMGIHCPDLVNTMERPPDVYTSPSCTLKHFMRRTSIMWHTTHYMPSDMFKTMYRRGLFIKNPLAILRRTATIIPLSVVYEWTGSMHATHASFQEVLAKRAIRHHERQMGIIEFYKDHFTLVPHPQSAEIHKAFDKALFKDDPRLAVDILSFSYDTAVYEMIREGKYSSRMYLDTN